jgi:8-oxo-dGTP pyrophosphatase MutT (NUDIX family)
MANSLATTTRKTDIAGQQGRSPKMGSRKEPKSVVLSTRGILSLPDKGVLMLRRAASHENDPLQDHYELPGGKFEAGDKAIETALVMEFLEETGLPISSGEVVSIWDEANGIEKYGPNTHYVCIFYHVHLVYPHISEVVLNPKEHSEYKWVKIPEGLSELGGKGIYRESQKALEVFYREYMLFPDALRHGPPEP